MVLIVSLRAIRELLSLIWRLLYFWGMFIRIGGENAEKILFRKFWKL